MQTENVNRKKVMLLTNEEPVDLMQNSSGIPFRYTKIA